MPKAVICRPPAVAAWRAIQEVAVRQRLAQSNADEQENVACAQIGSWQGEHTWRIATRVAMFFGTWSQIPSGTSSPDRFAVARGCRDQRPAPSKRGDHHGLSRGLPSAPGPLRLECSVF